MARPETDFEQSPFYRKMLARGPIEATALLISHQLESARRDRPRSAQRPQQSPAPRRFRVLRGGIDR